MAKNKKIIELNFDSSKEKMIILVKQNCRMSYIEKMIELIEDGKDSNVIFLPSELIDEIKIIKDKKK